MMTTQPRLFFGPRARRIALCAIAGALSSAPLSSAASADQARPAATRAPVHAGKACRAELAAVWATHPAARSAIGQATLWRLERAAQAHGRALLTWQAELLDRVVSEDPALHPTRKAFLAASSGYLKCRHAALGDLPDWQPRRGDTRVPTSWALPGDLLFTETGCAVFLRGEAAGLPGTGQGPTDRTGWRWSGRCSKGMAEGPGTAEVVLRSGETRLGLLGNGFAQATLRNARMEGLFQATDETRDDPSWRDHFDRYANGRVVQRVQRRENGALFPITYRETGNGWMWVDVRSAKESEL